MTHFVLLFRKLYLIFFIKYNYTIVNGKNKFNCVVFVMSPRLCLSSILAKLSMQVRYLSVL
jgi:hypothetical protein